MPQPHYPTFDEVKLLLDHKDVRQYEQEYAGKAGLTLLPYPIQVPPQIQRELYLANLTAEDAVNIFRDNKDRFEEFSSHYAGYWKNEPIDGEFSEGEEPDPDDMGEEFEVVGITAGFTPTRICHYHLASQGDSKALLLFLERTRMPFRREFCTFLRKIYREAHKQQG